MKVSKKIGTKFGIGIGIGISEVKLGPELIVNSGFNTGGSPWYVNGESTINTGVGRIYSSAGTFSAINQANVFEIGKNYKIEYDVVDDTIEGTGLRSATTSIIFPASIGHHVVFGIGDATTFTMKGASGMLDVSVDNVSVREML